MLLRQALNLELPLRGTLITVTATNKQSQCPLQCFCMVRLFKTFKTEVVVQKKKRNILKFSDDIVLLAENKEDLEKY